MKMYLIVLSASLFISTNISCMNIYNSLECSSDAEKNHCITLPFAKEPDCIGYEWNCFIQDLEKDEELDKIRQDLQAGLDAIMAAKARFLEIRKRSHDYYSQLAHQDLIRFNDGELTEQLDVINKLCDKFFKMIEGDTYKEELLDMLNKKKGEFSRCYFQQIREFLPYEFTVKLVEELKKAIGPRSKTGPSHETKQQCGW